MTDTRNPYTPPTASVADPPEVSIPRPRDVTLAVRLQWVSFVMGFASGLLHESWGGQPAEWIVALISIAIYAAIIAWLIFKLSRGRNWARITYTVLSLLGYVSIAFSWRSYFGNQKLVALDVVD